MATKTKKIAAKAEKKEIEKIVLKGLSVPELIEKADKLKKEINQKRLEIKVGRVRNVRLVFNLRKELARILSVLSEKNIVK